jgi:hypothetical protein
MWNKTHAQSNISKCKALLVVPISPRSQRCCMKSEKGTHTQHWGTACGSNMCCYNMWKACWMSLMVSEAQRLWLKRYNVAHHSTKHIKVVWRCRTHIGVHQSVSDAYWTDRTGHTRLYEVTKSWGIWGNVPSSDHVDVAQVDLSMDGWRESIQIELRLGMDNWLAFLPVKFLAQSKWTARILSFPNRFHLG